jgi:hypothetical protein
MRDVVWAALVVLCVPIWAWIVATRGHAVVEALRARRVRKRRERQPNYHTIARLEAELGFEESKVPEVPEWIVRDWDRVAVRRLFDHYGQHWS